ncbi:hypothetical protein JMF89_06920 [Clostridiaceae bacterium UIB06]|uniref:Uncharacterized protein n=1 Tax=Clostridium thailandense TaxID=2794346 RepID=A0A949TR73_9CLOT|nr:DUF5682 family protein [Clostridium thailandense]MBV7273897.1 hypothetical protein [Clostridium thailandense]MCH5136932.1 hypothetical protein [Clostridiaceae bacterium UIB06]
MDGILRGQEMDKIEEVFSKAYDLHKDIIYFPLRHHSPACSFHLKKVIENYNPDIILIEGPSDANAVTPYIGHAETTAPVCIYYSYSDNKKLVSAEGGKYRCYYPFLDYSPELTAIREGEKRGIKTEFIDLPYGEILINSAEGRGLRNEKEKNSYNDDYLFEKSKFITSLCEKQGCRTFNELWEMLFEIDGIKIETGTFIKNMIAFCYLSRSFESEDSLKEDGCIAREVYMASKIKEMSTEYKKILVVTGGFHTSGLIELSCKEETIKLHNIDKKDVGAYAMVYSFEESDQLNGYASGMPYPAFYQKIYENLCENLQNPYEKAVLHFIVSCGRKIRKSVGGLSTADEIEALNMAKGLQTLRNKAECGVYELKDAVRACFIKGELNMATDAPLMELLELLRGKNIGKLCDSTEVPPIIIDFRDICSKYKLKINNTLEQEIVLDLYKSSRHREISYFLHRMSFLNIGFCKNIKGPDFINKKNVNLIRETFKYKWNVQVESGLIENSVYGGTVKEAVETLLLKEITKNKNESGEVSELLIKAFMMGYYQIILKVLPDMKEIIIKDGSFYSVAHCAYNICFLYNGTMLFSGEESCDIKELLLQAYNKAVTLIPELYAVPEEEENKVIDKLKNIYQITLESNSDIDIFKEALFSLTDRVSGNAAVEGAALGLLLGVNEIDSLYIIKKAEGYLYGTGDKFLKSAAFLKGLFSTARDIVLSEAKMLTAIDNVMKNMEEENFLRLLPELRLSFSFFTPGEIDSIGKALADYYEISERKLFDVEAAAPEELKFALELDSFGVDTLKEWGLINEG